MALPDEPCQKNDPTPSEIVVIRDNGGTRSGVERRQKEAEIEGPERRSERERRQTPDRRAGIDRRQSDDRHSERYFWDGRKVERRDAFRKRNEP